MIGLDIISSYISEEDFTLIRGYIKQNSGIAIGPEKNYLIETRLTRLMAESGAETFGQFYQYIKSGKDPLIRQKIINAISTNETMWFRDASPWAVLEKIYLPRLTKALASGLKTRVRIWSAAVSTGQEVYSAVMCVDKYLQENAVKGAALSDFEFIATDISSRALDIAKKGRYDKISITRGLNENYRKKYFVMRDSAWDIEPKIREAVTFMNFNLQNDYRKLGSFDIILCRYVLIYFSDELKKEVITKMHGALAEDGVLFTGNYVLYDFFDKCFEVNHYENMTYYSKKGGE